MKTLTECSSNVTLRSYHVKLSVFLSEGGQGETGKTRRPQGKVGIDDSSVLGVTHP